MSQSAFGPALKPAAVLIGTLTSCSDVSDAFVACVLPPNPTRVHSRKLLQATERTACHSAGLIGTLTSCSDVSDAFVACVLPQNPIRGCSRKLLQMTDANSSS